MLPAGNITHTTRFLFSFSTLVLVVHIYLRPLGWLNDADLGLSVVTPPVLADPRTIGLPSSISVKVLACWATGKRSNILFPKKMPCLLLACKWSSFRVMVKVRVRVRVGGWVGSTPAAFSHHEAASAF